MSPRKFVTHTKALIVMPEGEPIYSEQATTVEMDDESGGPFVCLVQHGRVEEPGRHRICINPDEWPALRDAIDTMIAECGRMVIT